ncbi:hypothetical protein ABZP36_001099 [Zizania latifolia]
MRNLAASHCTQLHCSVLKSGAAAALSVSNALIALCLKCDTTEASWDARKVLDEMPDKDDLPWTTMVVGYVRTGDVHSARSVSEEVDGEFDVHLGSMDMVEKLPSFLAILTACYHAGLVDEGFHYFESMKRDFGISPGEDHYGLSVYARLIDLLGQAGRIGEATDLIKTMPFEPTPSPFGR